MSADKHAPEYRVAAFANLDLRENMLKHPLGIPEPGDVDWTVSEKNGRYIADGEIKIPVVMHFVDSEDDNDDLTVTYVEIGEMPIFDIEKGALHAAPLHDPVHGVDVIRIVADARHMRKPR